MAVQRVIPEKRSAVEKIMQGLQVAQAVYGVKSSYDQNKLNQMKMDEMEQSKRRDEGQFKTKEVRDLYMVGADSPLYKETIEGTNIETGEKFRYLPEEKLKKIKTATDITADIQKSSLEREYTTGRVRPDEIKTAVEVFKGTNKPQGQGWVKRWDIENGKQIDLWIKPSASAQYFLAQEKAQESREMNEFEKKTKFAKEVVDIAPALQALKTVDARIQSDDPKAAIVGGNELVVALKQKGVLNLFSSREAWKSPEALNAAVANAGPEARALWQDIMGFAQRVLKAESGAAVTESEANRIFSKLGASAFSSVDNLKQGFRNAKLEFMRTIQAKELPLFEGGAPSGTLMDMRKSPGMISSDDPLFDTFKQKKPKAPLKGELDDL